MERAQRTRTARLENVVTFKVCPDPDKPEQARRCSAAHVLRESLAEEGSLQRFRDVYGHSEGDCREAATALMVDLSGAGRTEGWTLVEGRRAGEDHCWLEFDGWAVDVSTQTAVASGGGILFMDAAMYRRGRVIISSETADQVRDRLSKMSSS
jgi:hypothetical protein